MPDFPFDSRLLALSPLYRASRALYLELGGQYRPTLVSAPRTLSSPILLTGIIEYTPLEAELVWAATDPGERGRPATLARLAPFVSSVYHEQNHRILWRRVLPSAPMAPKARAARRRYMNLAESLVIIADMALGDDLGPKLGELFRAIGVIYDPGTDARKAAGSPRAYRNYLQACLHATYLNLELFEPKLIENAVTALYSSLVGPKLLERAIRRSGRLNRGFVTGTNLVWQRRHDRLVAERLGRKGETGLEVSDHPLDNLEQYKAGERWFDLLKLA